MTKSTQEIIWSHTPHSEYPSYWHESNIEEMMEEYSKQQSIAFQEFINKEDCQFRNGKWQRWVPFDFKSKALVYYTMDELYDAFLKYQTTV